MNTLSITNAAPEISSREIATLTNKRHDNVMRVADELKVAGIIPEIKECFVINELAGGRKFREYQLNKRDSLVLVARLSPEFMARIIDRWQELEAGVAPVRQLSAAEMFFQTAQVMVEIERVQIQQAQQVAAITARVEQVEQSQVLSERPQNAESITHMRPRAAKVFGIPERIVEYIIRQTPYAPKPAGMVRNEREEANGATYAVYWIKDINDVMRRFVGECKMVTAQFATHPYVDGRFRLIREEVAA